MVGLLVATVFGTLSVSATLIKKQDIKPFIPICIEETGSIGAVVFYEQLGKTSNDPKYVFITDATVFCIDINGDTHEMVYEEIHPEFYAYVAAEVPVGECEITASKEGFSSETISTNVMSGHFELYRIELDKHPISRSVFVRLFENVLRAFPILYLLLTH